MKGLLRGLIDLHTFILGEPSIKDVMAFPTSALGQASVMDAPSEAADGQLKELGVMTVGKK